MGEYFDTSLDELVDHLPSWWATDNPASEIRKHAAAAAALIDELAEQVEGIHADQALITARDEALRTEWASLYGVSREDFPLDTETLRQYLQARAAEDGSIGSLEETLLALLRLPGNDIGTELTFPLDGSGLTFPADGLGLMLFQATIERSLRFPPDGSGLTFPVDGSGLTFPSTSRLEITEAYSAYRLDITVRDFLAFDRAAFARAVARFRQAHMVPPTITETPA